GGGGAGAVAVTVITKHTEAVIGGGAVVDADANGTALDGVYGGALNSEGTFPTGSLMGVVVQANSSESVFGLGASGAGGLFVGIAGAVTVEVIDSDTLAHIIGGAEVNQNTADSAAAQQSVNVSAVNDLHLLALDGSLGARIVGVGASVDVGVTRDDTTAASGGAGTKVRANGAVDVNALSHRDLSSNTISVGAGGLALAGGIIVYSVGGNFGSSYTENADGGSSKSADALDSDKGDVTSSVEGTVGGLVGGFTRHDSGQQVFAASSVNSAADTIDLGSGNKLHANDQVVYHNGSGTSVGGLVDGKTYIVVVPDASQPNVIQLADADTGTVVDLTSAGSGTNHQ